MIAADAAPALPIDELHLALAASLLLLHAGASLLLDLRVGRELLVAALRMVVQLLLVGVVLKALFANVSPLFTLLTGLVMILFAGREIAARQQRRLSGLWSYALGTGSMLFATLAVTLFALGTAVRPDPWYDPRYAIPLLGMILGNTMNGISLGLHALATGLARDRVAVEAQLCLGATRWAATRPVVRVALRTGLMPIVNSMAATGLVAIHARGPGSIRSSGALTAWTPPAPWNGPGHPAPD